MSSISTILQQAPAKSEPYQTVLTHGIVSGIVAQTLLERHISVGTRLALGNRLKLEDTELSKFIGYLASLHDIGKLAPKFSANILQNLKDDVAVELRNSKELCGLPGPGVRHEETGKRILSLLWKERNEPQDACSLFSNIIGAHHQGKKLEVRDFKKSSPWKPVWVAFEEEMSKRFMQSASAHLPIVENKNDPFLGAILNGLIIMADWIASGPFFQNVANDVRENEVLEIRSKAEQFVNLSSLDSEAWETGTTFDTVWPGFAGKARPLQKQVEEVFSGTADRIRIMLIEAPMGEGKTEASVYAAAQMARQWGKNGLYFALPTAATANQMVRRIESFLEDNHSGKNVRLLHSMAWLQEEDNPSLVSFQLETTDAKAATDWLKPKKRALLSNWAVGTVDQAMMAAMFIKYGVLRLLGLSNKVLVIDEVHAYDAYMGSILQVLLQWCRALDIPVVLLSATLPKMKKSELLGCVSDTTDDLISAKYPAITYITESGDVRTNAIESTMPREDIRIELQEMLHDIPSIAKLAREASDEGGCVGVLVNTVKEAQAIYSEIIAQMGNDEDVFLFHSRFPARRRQEIETECLERFGPSPARRARRAILVCTQVVEQSLDIDFDRLITSIAPMDLLLQRAGRLHRHADTNRPGKLQDPELHVLVPTDGQYSPDDNIYPQFLLSQTQEILQMNQAIHQPDDIPRLVEMAYDPALVPAESMENWIEIKIKETQEKSISKEYKLEPPEFGFEPLRNFTPFDDMEDRGYISARTRLETSPSVRIALLEPALYQRFQKETENGRKYSMVLAKEVMENSVSVPQMDVQEFPPPLTGEGLLYGVQIYPSIRGRYEKENGAFLSFDKRVGFLKG